MWLAPGVNVAPDEIVLSDDIQDRALSLVGYKKGGAESATAAYAAMPLQYVSD